MMDDPTDAEWDRLSAAVGRLGEATCDEGEELGACVSRLVDQVAPLLTRRWQVEWLVRALKAGRVVEFRRS